MSEAKKTRIHPASNPGRRWRSAVALFAVLAAGASPARAHYTYEVLHAFEGPPRYPSAALVKGSDGALYGTTPQGGMSVYGTVFKIGEDGSGFTILHNFDYTSGAYPRAAVVSSGGVLYGTTQQGGMSGYGIVFKIGEDGSGFTILHNFDNAGGANPQAALVGSGGVLYGTTFGGGTSGYYGTVFRIGEDGSGFTILHNFNKSGGANPQAALVSPGGGVLYGTTANGGTSGYGTVFKVGEDGSGFTILHNFNNTGGAYPQAAVVSSGGGVLYGTTPFGGTSGYGTVFAIDEDGSGFTILHNFNNTYTQAALVSSSGILYGTTASGGDTFVYGTVFRIGEDGSGFTILHSFNNTNGAFPQAALLSSGGVLYGTTAIGGTSVHGGYGYGGYGTVFKIGEDGSGFTILHNFNNASGAYPQAALVGSGGGVLYGTTPFGGTSGYGTVFEIGEDGTGFTILHNFNNTSGATPQAALVSSGGVLYGTTAYGGTSGYGTVFEIGEDGTGFTVLHNFDNTSGATPQAALVSSGGVLYGTTAYGGTSGYGTVFKVGEDGSGFTVLHNFNDTYPQAALVSSGGVLYGTTPSGGAFGHGTVFKIGEDGLEFTVLHNFNYTSGHPRGGVAISGGVLYGTTQEGGTSRYGTVFRIGEDGSGFTILHNFNHRSGAYPQASLVSLSGVLYGTTPEGGASGYGTVFEIGEDGSEFTILHNFDNTGGAYPQAALVGAGGVLHGTGAQGGASGGGVVFRLTLDTAVVRPNGGERLFGDASYLIEWAAADALALGGFDVLASVDGGLTFDPIPECTGLVGSARSCTWLGPGPLTSLGRIRVVARDGSGHGAADVSDGNFTIVAGPALVGVTAPDTALSWGIGGLWPIRWSHNLGRVSAVSIELSRDGGTSWSLLAAGVRNATASTGQFNWVVSGPSTTAALVRVSWMSNPGVTDVSNTTFAITNPFLTVTAPTAGVRWGPGRMRAIRWNHNLGRSASVNIDMSRDGGATWQAIVANLASSRDTTGNLNWLVTGPTTAAAAIRVSWATNPAVQDSSDTFGIEDGSRIP